MTAKARQPRRSKGGGARAWQGKGKGKGKSRGKAGGKGGRNVDYEPQNSSFNSSLPAHLPRILNVAEKNSVAREITKHLSQGRNVRQIRSGSDLQVSEFPFLFQGREVGMVVTAIRGHLMELDFAPEYKSWNSCDARRLISVDLFEAPVLRKVNSSMTGLKTGLHRLARESETLVLWLDCDREGEAIAFEVMEVCSEANRGLRIFRANFSALTYQDLTHAVSHLGTPNVHMSDAVRTRSEIDLRIGAAFTRFLTMRYRNRINLEANSNGAKLISYGPCQFPTLGFVVERWMKIQNFEEENFWTIKAKLQKSGEEAQKPAEFSWGRHRVFDHDIACLLYESCLAESQGSAVVTQLYEQPKSKCMKIAEELYHAGRISYPRTETDRFNPTIDVRSLVQVQQDSNAWGEYASRLVRGGFRNPRIGPHDDQAHPPIHPVQCVSEHDLPSAEHWKVFELISRHFLACCSEDARGSNTHCEVMIGRELFKADGLMVNELNWLDVYPYDKWTSSAQLPKFYVGERVPVSSLLLTEGKTSPPLPLAEKELIELMDKHGIGTDATMHDHIKTVQDRKYVLQDRDSRFLPSTLGVALVEGFGAFRSALLHLARPELRSWMESDMSKIARGELRREGVLRRFGSTLREIFERLQRDPLPLDAAMTARLANASPTALPRRPPQPGRGAEGG